MTRQRQECFSAICLLRIVKKAAFIGLLFWSEYFCKRLTMKTANKTILGGHWKRHLALFLHRTLKAALCDELCAQYCHVASRGQFLLLLGSTLSRWAFPLSCHSVQSRGLAPCGSAVIFGPLTCKHIKGRTTCSYNYCYVLSWCCISSISPDPPLLSTLSLHFRRLLWDGRTVISQFECGHIGNAYTQIITCSWKRALSHKCCVRFRQTWVHLWFPCSANVYTCSWRRRGSLFFSRPLKKDESCDWGFWQSFYKRRLYSTCDTHLSTQL